MKSKVVIIGAGISGCSIAYHLAKTGVKDILVLDSSYLTSGATGRCGAGIRQQWATEANCILAKKSMEFFSTAKEELEYDGDIEFKQEGYLILATTKEEDQQFTKNVEMQNRLGIPAKKLSVKEALEIVPYLNPDSFISATFCHTDGHLNPFKMTEAFYLAAKRLGVIFHFFEEVTSITTESNKIVGVQTNKSYYEANIVVNAAGGFAHEIGLMVGVDIPVYSENHEILVTEPIEKMQGPMVMSFSKNLYCQQVPHGSFLMGRTTPHQLHDHNISSSWSFLDEMSKTICDIAPIIGELRVIRQWGGSYNNSPDKQPIISKVKEVDGFFTACGFSGHGFMFSPMTGRLMKELILNQETTVDKALYDLERFKEMKQATVESSVV
ncbi:MAG: NAD(P)/FAD-dependent oxidoreductase [Candidatus Izemoplasmatales bacterium]